jgi:hypothetical protein
VLLATFVGVRGYAQCLSLPTALETQLHEANGIFEGKVVAQASFMGTDGNIYTSNHVEVCRVLKGSVGFEADIVTEGGVYGDLMQLVTPGVSLAVGDYGLVVTNTDEHRSIAQLARSFYPIDERTGAVSRLKGVEHREQLYGLVAGITGSDVIELRRISLLEENSGSRSTPEISSVDPVQVTAGTQTVITITGSNFGAEQGNGRVAFRNADDGGQSYVSIAPGPHYLSWSDTEVQLYVPSATLYDQAVAGSGTIRVINDAGMVAQSSQQLAVNFAKSEVIYTEQLSSTLLIGDQTGGYIFTPNNNFVYATNGTGMASKVLQKWACNTGVNFSLSSDVVNSTAYANDDVNLLGFSASGQLPSYLLGRTVTTFSGCGGSNGLQWNLIEVDILLNSDLNWWTDEGQPMSGTFDLETALLHELGHAMLLQHNNDPASPMYFQLTEGSMRRNLYDPSLEGGNYVVTQSVEATNTCGQELHQYFESSNCDLSVINGLDESSESTISAFPNPFQDQVTISGDWSPGTTFCLVDATGRRVLSGVLNADNQTVGATALPRGMYLLEVRDDAGLHMQRLIKN